MTESGDKCKFSEAQWKIDHDLLVAHLARFAEYVKATDERMGKLNELREQVTQDREFYLRNDVYNARHEDLRRRLEAVADGAATRHDNLQKELNQRLESAQKELEQHMESTQRTLEQRIQGNYSTLDERIRPVTDAQSKMLGIGQGAWAMIVLAVGVLAALIGHLWK